MPEKLLMFEVWNAWNENDGKQRASKYLVNGNLKEKHYFKRQQSVI